MKWLNKNGNGTYGLSALELNSKDLCISPLSSYLSLIKIVWCSVTGCSMYTYSAMEKIEEIVKVSWDSMRNTALKGFIFIFLMSEEERIPLV